MTQRLLGIVALVAALAVPAIQVDARAQGGTSASPATTRSAVEVTTTLSRTAAWVGDRIVYTVELRTLPGFDIVLEDLGQDRLRVDGGEVLAVEDDHEPLGERTVRRVRYTLVANRPEATSLRVPALVVRYYERGSDGATRGAPAGQVVVPTAVVSVRSTLPDGAIVAGPRTPSALHRAPRWLRLVGPVGVALVIVTILPVLLYLLRAGPHARAGWSRIQTRREQRRRRHAFADVKELAPSTDADRIAAFGRLEAFVRDHLEVNAGLPAFALTPAEVRQALAARDEVFAPEDVERLLEACERARYAPAPPSHEEWTDAVRDAEQILRRGRR